MVSGFIEEIARTIALHRLLCRLVLALVRLYRILVHKAKAKYTVDWFGLRGKDNASGAFEDEVWQSPGYSTRQDSSDYWDELGAVVLRRNASDYVGFRGTIEDALIVGKVLRRSACHRLSCRRHRRPTARGGASRLRYVTFGL